MAEVTNRATPLTEQKRRSRLMEFIRRLVREQPLGTVGGIIVLLLLFCGIFADMLAPYGMNEIHLLDRYAPPSWKYPLGADQLGRDILSRIIHGARISVIIGLSATSINLVVALLIGATIGFFGGKFDWFLTDSKVVMTSSMGMRCEICRLFYKITYCADDSNFHFGIQHRSVVST